jgi:tetratricopeptide (TPR) repeat protein
MSTLSIPWTFLSSQGEELDARFLRVLRKLQQLPGRNLLVIDNAQEQVAQKEVYDALPGLPNWRVLLTSRLDLDGFERMRLDTLAPDAARELFRMHFKGPCTEEELEALLEEIGYHTLTVELMGRLLSKLNNLLSVSGLTGTLRQKQLDDPELQEKVWARHSGEERGIFLHLMKAFELTNLTDPEVWLLKQFVVLPVERYAVATLADFLQEKPLGLNKTLNNLAAKGWLTWHEDKTFSIHRLIRQVAEYQLRPRFEDVEALVGSMIRMLEVDAYTSRIKASVPWLKYATTVEHFFSEEKQTLIAELQNEIALIYSDLGQYAEALRHHQKCLAIREAVLAADHPNLAQSYNNIAGVYQELGQYSEALRYHQKCLAIREAVPAADHSKLAQSYNNIAGVYHKLGQYSEALGYQQNCIAIWKAVLAADHPNLASAYNNIAGVYQELGQYSKALRYHQKSLAIRESVLAPDNPDLALSYNSIANTYHKLGQYSEALRYHQNCIAIWKAVLAADHLF